MTTQEIKDKIAFGIKGQGTNIDGGGVLAEILEAIVGAIPSVPVQSDWAENDEASPSFIKNRQMLVIKDITNQEDITKNEVVSILGITEAQLDLLMRGGYPLVMVFSSELVDGLCLSEPEQYPGVDRQWLTLVKRETSTGLMKEVLYIREKDDGTWAMGEV